jgi:hypothetical protein
MRLPRLVPRAASASLLAVAFTLTLAALTALRADDRPRLFILTDIGGDPDDQQSLVRLLVYANEFQLEGLVASASGTPGELKESVTRTDLIRASVDAYEKVLPNLQRHAPGWPTADALRGVIRSGNPLRGRDHIGEGHDTEGSRWLLARVDAGDEAHPLNLSVWGGQTDLAQALWRVKHDRGPAGLAAFVRRLRVYDINDQDKIAPWIHTEFPGLFYILSQAPAGRDKREGQYRGVYLGGDEALTSREWVEQSIRSRGPLGALYPVKAYTAPNPHACMKEGDTPSWFFFLPLGGNDPRDPAKPGWAGQYRRGDDGWYYDVPPEGKSLTRDNVSRWRPAFQADFARRMAWCVAP